MLSRTASDLYWMSRYLERAENLARMLEVSYSLSLMPQAGRSDGHAELAMSLLSAGTLDDYNARYDALNTERMLHFLRWTKPTPAVSIAACVLHEPMPMPCAGVSPPICGRTSTPPGWRCATSPATAWAATASAISANGSRNVRTYSVARRRARSCATTPIASFAWAPSSSGPTTPCACWTRYEMFGEESEEVSDNSARGYYQWSALLRALSSFEAFNEIYRNAPNAEQVSKCCCCEPTFRARCTPASKNWTISSPACRATTAVSPAPGRRAERAPALFGDR